jgi:hypothetical protein
MRPFLLSITFCKLWGTPHNGKRDNRISKTNRGRETWSNSAQVLSPPICVDEARDAEPAEQSGLKNRRSALLVRRLRVLSRFYGIVTLVMFDAPLSTWDES